jgi:hypothetical protein
MGLKRFFGIVMAACFMFSTSAWAADLKTLAKSGRCLIVTKSDILNTPNQSGIYAEVDRRYSHALKVSKQSNVIYSNRPTFVWSVEAKVSCAKALGFLDSGEVHEVLVSKCDCFYDRMIYYLYR